jgi:methylenetetrahydrofolate reductase (NADPH)
MRVSVELVPKSAEQVRADAAIVRAASSAFTALNIPDLTHFDLRSWEGCRLTKDIFAASIPHIRAIDLGEREEDDLCRFLHEHELSEVLVVRGDPPRDLSRRTYPNASEDVIRRLKSRLPNLRVFAAFDPYRHGYVELEGVRRKLEAGADARLDGRLQWGRISPVAPCRKADSPCDGRGWLLSPPGCRTFAA